MQPGNLGVIDASRPGSVPFASRFAALMALTGEGKDMPLVFGTNYIRRWVVGSVNLTATVQHGPVILRGSITLELTECISTPRIPKIPSAGPPRRPQHGERCGMCQPGLWRQ